MKDALNILNLEDNSMDAELIQAMVSARWPDSHFTRVETGEDFAAMLEKGGLDLILSDYSMPSFDGRRALELARQKCPDVPFLFVSGTIGEDWAIEALKNGATDYVLKERMVRLIPAVDRALRDVQQHREREQAEEAMRESEHKYRVLFECLGDAAFLTDEQTGKILDANRSAEQLLGCSRAELLGRKQSEFIGVDEARLKAAGEPGLTIQACDVIRLDGRKVRSRLRFSRLTLYNRTLNLLLCHELDDCGET
jgi:PAS domain S-box-containing protein